MFMLQSYIYIFFFNDTATTEIYTLSLHDALPIYVCGARPAGRRVRASGARARIGAGAAAPDPGAARGLRAEAHGRIGVRGDCRGHGRDGGLAQDADASRVRPAAGADEGASMMASYHPLVRSEEHTSELQSQSNLVCRLLLEKQKANASI